MLPLTSALPRGSSPLTLMAVTVLPLPLSPTSPKISPSAREKDTPSTAFRVGAAL